MLPYGWLVTTGLALILAGCGALPAPTPPAAAAVDAPADLPPAVSGTPEEAAPALIMTEREAARTRDLALLARLWAADARIVDGRSSGEPGDDYAWQGRDAILDRYVLAVFPAPPPDLDAEQLSDLEVIRSSEGAAQAQVGIDHWTLVYRDGRWWLAELRYN